MAHLKRLTSPKSWDIKRKETIYIAKPSPGPHKLKEGITLNLMLKDILNLSTTRRETKKILNAGMVQVDYITRKDNAFPVGYMDIITLPTIKEVYRVVYTKKGKLTLQKLKTDPKEKLCKIINKKILPKKKIQINMYDGKNIIVTKDTYKVGDTVALHEGKITKHFKLEKNAWVYLIGGKHIAESGKLLEIKKSEGVEKDRIIIQAKDNKIETLKKYAFVIEKPFE
jgi:small subunit ribosomal protein S4e